MDDDDSGARPISDRVVWDVVPTQGFVKTPKRGVLEEIGFWIEGGTPC